MIGFRSLEDFYPPLKWLVVGGFEIVFLIFSNQEFELWDLTVLKWWGWVWWLGLLATLPTCHRSLPLLVWRRKQLVVAFICQSYRHQNHHHHHSLPTSKENKVSTLTSTSWSGVSKSVAKTSIVAEEIDCSQKSLLTFASLITAEVS